MKAWKGFWAAVGFLTVLPVPRRWQATAAGDFGLATAWFPVVGALIGLLASGLAYLYYRYLPPAVAAVLTVGTLVFLQGGLHLDGLADTADGFLSCRGRERVLEIMKDSRIGTFGVAAIVFALALQGAAVASLGSGERLGAIFLAPFAGRCVMAPMLACLKPARPGGMGEMFSGGAAGALAALSLAALGLAAWLVAGGRGLVAVAALLAVLLGFVWECRRKIGGYTGDTLGAASEITETLALLLL